MHVFFFIYSWQLAGCIHILGHFTVGFFLGIKSEIVIPWQRLIPLWGWNWNLTQPHTSMMCHYDIQAISTASPMKRVLIGFAGPYSQLLFIICMGTLAFPIISDLCGGFCIFSLLMCMWQFTYFVWYAIHFHEDEFSDFNLFIRQTQ